MAAGGGGRKAWQLRHKGTPATQLAVAAAPAGSARQSGRGRRLLHCAGSDASPVRPVEFNASTLSEGNAPRWPHTGGRVPALSGRHGGGRRRQQVAAESQPGL